MGFRMMQKGVWGVASLLVAMMPLAGVAANSVPVVEAQALPGAGARQPVVAPVPSTQPLATELAAVQPVTEQTASGSSGNRNLVADLLQRLQQMEQELADLRGKVEEQGHQLQVMQQDQRDRYLDLDRRVTELSEQPATNSGSGSTAPPSQGRAPTLQHKVATATASEKQLYQDALGLMRQRKFDDAIKELNSFLTQYPNSPLAVNAQYWLGELYLAQQNFSQARDAFSRVLSQYPGSSKSADATYKLGITWSQLGEASKAKTELNRVIKDYPSSGAARLAKDYLKTIGG